MKLPGFAFYPDDMQLQFESAFEYEETEGQLKRQGDWRIQKNNDDLLRRRRFQDRSRPESRLASGSAVSKWYCSFRPPFLQCSIIRRYLPYARISGHGRFPLPHRKTAGGDSKTGSPRRDRYSVGTHRCQRISSLKFRTCHCRRGAALRRRCEEKLKQLTEMSTSDINRDADTA